jgi:hypothetical protein
MERSARKLHRSFPPASTSAILLTPQHVWEGALCFSFRSSVKYLAEATQEAIHHGQHSTNLATVSNTHSDINTHQIVLGINTYCNIEHSLWLIMRNLIPPSILFIMLPIISAKYLPIRARQAAPTTTPAVLILEQNPGCCLLSSALSVCTALTPGFTTFAPSDQAPCLCYSSTVWAPDIFDNAVKTCADFASREVRYPDSPSNISNAKLRNLGRKTLLTWLKISSHPYTPQ